jgi:hypothetical protein
MKRATLALCLLQIGATVFAADFGIILDNLSGLSSFDYGTPLQRDRATAWLSTRLSASVDLDASLRFDYLPTAQPSWFGSSNFGLDVGRLEVQATFPGNADNPVSWSIGGGRFQYAFLSEEVFSGRLDGINARIDVSSARWGFALGYLGLIPKTDNRTLLSADDIADYSDGAIFFAPPRIVVDAALTLLELFARQDLSIELSSQFDLRGLAATAPAEIVHTQYLSFILSGSLGKNLFHAVHADVGIGETTNDRFLMASGGYSLGFYMPELARARLELLIEYASGETGFLSRWRPISERQMGFVYNASFVDCVSATLDASLVPLASITIGIKGSAFLRTSTQAVPDAQFDSASKDSYLGTEADLYAVFRPGSDFSVSATFGAFLPASGLSYLPDTAPRLLASGTVTLSL